MSADISRVSRDGGGKLIGHQRPEVKRHVWNIVDDWREFRPRTLIASAPA